jgi:hypothetical protein
MARPLMMKCCNPSSVNHGANTKVARKPAGPTQATAASSHDRPSSPTLAPARARPHSSLGDLTPEAYAERGLARHKEGVSFLTADSNPERD